MAAQPTVTTTLQFASQDAQSARFRALGARYVKPDPVSGLPLYKTAAGLVLRVRSAYTVEVLANCAC